MNPNDPTQQLINFDMSGQQGANAVSQGNPDLGQFLPLIGGIGGELIGGPIGAAAGAGIGEAIHGATDGRGMQPGDIAAQAALSGIGGPLAGKLLGKAGGIATETYPKRIMNQLFKETVPETKAGIRKGADTLGEQALQNGEMGTTKGILSRAQRRIQTLEDQLQGKLDSSNATIPFSEIDSGLAPLFNEFAQSGNTNAAQNLLKRLDSIHAANGNEIPVGVANQIKRELYDEAEKAYVNPNPTANQDVLKNVAHTLKQQIADKVEGVDGINQRLGYNGRLVQSLVDKETRDGRNKPFGLTDFGAAGVGMATGGIPAALGLIGGEKVLGSTLGKTIGANALYKAGQIPGQDAIKTVLGQSAVHPGAFMPSIPPYISNQADNSTQNQIPNESQNHNGGSIHELSNGVKVDAQGNWQLPQSQQDNGASDGSMTQDQMKNLLSQYGLIPGAAEAIKASYDAGLQQQQLQMEKAKMNPDAINYVQNEAPLVNEQMNELRQLIKQEGTGPLNDPAPVQWLKAQRDPNYARMMALMTTLSGIATKANVGGRLSNFDIQHLSNMPTVGDSTQSALAKLDQAQSVIANQYARLAPLYGNVGINTDNPNLLPQIGQ